MSCENGESTAGGTLLPRRFPDLIHDDTLVCVLGSAHYFITVTDQFGTRRYEFFPTTVTTSAGGITITYDLKDPRLANSFAAELADNTSTSPGARSR